MPTLDIDTVRHALTVARERGFAEVELQLGEDIFQATLERAATPKGSNLAAPVQESPAVPIAAGLVGYYRPGRVPLVVGQVVHPGDIVGTIVALGIANDVECKVAGEVIVVLVEADQPVQYGQALAMVKP
jgi:biotin carboxyl carrier protein